ncbi:hypothetical protein cand_031860 [Cryptosporidium andersoni]|uniref:Uncharacterized protein n=1 Tax=Cryptosporidium andersoni TaxID=117008 RepID=A0A1J4MB71_9CRYT|nr:hypothetical protein cand_031860 [Cryptosporidium andersoni]
MDTIEYENTNIQFQGLPELHQLLLSGDFNKFLRSLKSLNSSFFLDESNQNILTFSLFLFESLLQCILCSGSIFDHLENIKDDMLFYLKERKKCELNYTFRITNEDGRGFTLLPLDYKYSIRSTFQGSNSPNFSNTQLREDMYKDPVVPPKEFLEVIGYKEPITQAAIFQFPCEASAEELMNEKNLIDTLRQQLIDESWTDQLNSICKFLTELSKIVVTLVTNYQPTYEKFCSETSGLIYKSMKFPLFYLALMKVLFDEYPIMDKTQEELNPKDPGDSRRLVNIIRRNRLPGLKIIEFIFNILTPMTEVLDILGGSSAWNCRAQYAQYFLHLAFVFDNPKLFKFIAAKSYMFSYNIFQWDLLLNSMAQHIPLLDIFLYPLATAITRFRVIRRLESKNKPLKSGNSEQDDPDKNFGIEETSFGEKASIVTFPVEPRFLTNKIIKYAKSFYGEIEGKRLERSIQLEFNNWEYMPIRPDRIRHKLIMQMQSDESKLDEYRAELTGNNKRRNKTALYSVLPPLSYPIECKKNYSSIKEIPGQIYAQSYYSPKMDIPVGTKLDYGLT